MKTLLLFRHAKSDWEAEFGHDHDRPLNKRGKRAARRMGQFLAAAGIVSGRIVTSSAVRAVKTVELASEAGGWNGDVEINDALYEADPQAVLSLIQKQPEGGVPLLLVGHEPAFSATVSLLIGGGNVQMPTGSIACIEFDVDHWGQAKAAGGRLAWLVTPKLLEEGS
jgi:phosphohistidine phosphatase